MSKQRSVQLKEQLVLPVIMAPMFLVSSPEMIIAGCKAGIISSFPLLNARTTDSLEQWMEQITQGLAQVEDENTAQQVAPWAVNLIVHRTNQRYEADLELIKKYKPPIVITSLGNPQSVVDVVHEYGGLVFSDVINLTHAKKAATTGIDGLILVCNGAGGHAGTLNPVAFLGAVKEFWDGITIVAGCISRGQDILAMEVLGADMVYMGTRFIATSESFASEAYQHMLLESGAEDLIYTDAFSGVHANYLVPSIRNAGLDPNHLQKKESMDFSFSQAAETEAKAWKHIWSAGQGVGAIKQIAPIADVVAELRKEYEQARNSLMPAPDRL
ncbi:NAD(P)H-dependent flavin oxidoreductase [Aneurinibacillus uraniidurans]|uniref:NAD(P)H-dependent flavin oxidoreductase n=1 Tax=Aneurinibacillus uraniidurans TaxID=2966586 RepID=UPI002349B7D5|nr:nitronate monooxygenase [Aneurinibacillus sp. B1]WCN38748.1 nitronate monooxygenase [Aneurinibacillus sp. B1]